MIVPATGGVVPHPPGDAVAVGVADGVGVDVAGEVGVCVAVATMGVGVRVEVDVGVGLAGRIGVLPKVHNEQRVNYDYLWRILEAVRPDEGNG